MAHLLHTDWSLKPEKEKACVREQLERILEHSAFRNSKRCPALLRYIVEHTIGGDGSSIKERTLGIEVFGRAHDYDTNADPIVRATATEIRKRLAQYYREPGRDSDIVIDVPAGSYVPEFRSSSPRATALESATNLPSKSGQPFAPLRMTGLLAILCVATIAIGTGIWHVAAEPTPLDEFWSPVVTSPSSSVIIGVTGGCVNPGENVAPNERLPIPPRVGATPSVLQAHTSPCWGMGRMAMHDAIAMARVAGVLQSKGKSFEVRPTATIDYTELQKEPVVFIGLGSGWSVHIESQMRYRFKFDAGRNLTEIVDSKAPDENYWGIPMYWQDLPPGQMTRDYGLISRLTDPVTKQTVVALAGAGAPGTIAVANFLSDPKYMHDVLAKAPKDWSKKNMQVVIQTDVINGRSGPPTYVASQFW
jgi:hypothetical protein